MNALRQLVFPDPSTTQFVSITALIEEHVSVFKPQFLDDRFWRVDPLNLIQI